MRDPETIIQTAEREHAAIREHYVPAVEWFLDNQGLGHRSDVVEEVADALDIDQEVANLVVGHLVSDDVDPVQQVVQPTGGKFVGIISYSEHDWFYAFDRYDDIEGKQRRAVCAHCVNHPANTVDTDVTHYTRSPDEYNDREARANLGLHYLVDHERVSLPAAINQVFGVDADTVLACYPDRRRISNLSLREVTRAVEKLADEYESLQHEEMGVDVPPADVKPGATLASGTTIGGEKAWHAGNDGPGSDLDADKVDGRDAIQLGAKLEAGETVTAKTTMSAETKALTFANNQPSCKLGQLTYTADDSAVNLVNLNRTTTEDGSRPVEPNTPGVLITAITNNEKFSFEFSATGIYTVSVTASLKLATTFNI